MPPSKPTADGASQSASFYDRDSLGVSSKPASALGKEFLTRETPSQISGSERQRTLTMKVSSDTERGNSNAYKFSNMRPAAVGCLYEDEDSEFDRATSVKPESGIDASMNDRGSSLSGLTDLVRRPAENDASIRSPDLAITVQTRSEVSDMSNSQHVPSMSTVSAQEKTAPKDPVISKGLIERHIHYNQSIQSAEYDKMYAATGQVVGGSPEEAEEEEENKDNQTFGRPETADPTERNIAENSMVVIGQTTADRREQLIGNQFDGLSELQRQN